MQAIVPQAGIAERNPYINEETRQRVASLFTKRMEGNHYMRKFDNKLNLYTSDTLMQFNLSPLDEISRIIIQEQAENVEAAWNKWLNDNKDKYESIINELNANLLD